MVTVKTSTSMCAVCRPVAGLVFVLVLSFACRADIITTGYVSPSDPSTWTSSTTAIVGSIAADGELIVNGGSDVNSSNLYLAIAAETSAGTVTITGSGSSLTNEGLILVGNVGEGELNIQDGAQASNGNVCSVGYASMAVGRLNVDGAGSLINTFYFHVGFEGNGTANVRNGGTVTSSASVTVGVQDGSSGVLNVDGVGSSLRVEHGVRVGSNGSGTLNITNGGLVKAKTLDLDYNGDYDSRVNMATSGMLALEGEAYESIAEFLELLTGADELYFRTDNTGSWQYITDGTLGIDYFLSFIDDSTSDLYGYTVLTIAGEPATVPEPSTMLLLVSGLAVFVVCGFVGRRSIRR